MSLDTNNTKHKLIKQIIINNFTKWKQIYHWDETTMGNKFLMIYLTLTEKNLIVTQMI